MFMDTYVRYWRIDGDKRITRTITHNQFILNTNRMFEITETYNGHSQMYFFDNPADSRDGGARMSIWGDPTNIPPHADTDHDSNAITLDYFPDNDTTVATHEITLGKAYIAYCYPFNHDIASNYTWVLYSDGGWNMIRILVDTPYLTLYAELEPNA